MLAGYFLAMMGAYGIELRRQAPMSGVTIVGAVCQGVFVCSPCACRAVPTLLRTTGAGFFL